MSLHTDTKERSICWWRIIVAFPLSLICVALVVAILGIVLMGSSFGGQGSQQAARSRDILDQFDNFITNTASNALEGVMHVEKVYALDDSVQVAPEPNQANYGTTTDPASLQSVINKVHHRLENDELFFNADIKIREGSSITYYLDDTMFGITWKQTLKNVVYTFAEVKIQHPSQFRRFLADGKYGSDKQYLTSQMATSVNAVVASAGDFYKYRKYGVVVYNGEVERFNGTNLDNCYIDDQGDMIFSPAGEITSQEQLTQFVEENNIRFSLSFGPILINEGKSAVPRTYPVGEIAGNFSRAAICQLGPLHYLVVNVNDEGPNKNFPTLFYFADTLIELGIEKAYTLDGGQTATIVMNDKVINRVSYGAERYISDILYFATAIPESE